MDGHRFDDLARAVAAGSAPASRRRLLWGFAAGTGAGFAALLGIGTGRVGAAPAAAPNPNNEFCRETFNTTPGSIVSKNGCGTTRCGDDPRCFCVQTVGHVPKCAIGFDPTKGTRDCPTKDECSERRPCPRGSFCAKTEGCCGTPRKVCLRPCPA